MTQHVALYARISRDRGGRTEGVKAQEKWGRAYAARTWPGLPVEVFADNSLSAARDDVTRPEYERLREWLRAGKVAQVWAVEQSRLTRLEVAWFELAAELAAAGISEVHTTRDGIVRARDDVAGIMAVLAAGEARRVSKRTLARLGELAAAGRPHGVPPFGYSRAAGPDGTPTLALVPEQADAIRDAAGKVLAGWSLSYLAAGWAAAGLAGNRGGRPSATMVRNALQNPAVAGLRVHQGRVVGKANWPPILDDPLWRQVCARLAGPRTVATVDDRQHRVTIGHRTARRYLLTGTVVCGRCGTPLVGGTKTMAGRRVPYYVCHSQRGGCGRLGVAADPTEQHVLNTLMRELAKPEFLAALAADDHAARRDQLSTELADLERQREELAGMWGGRQLTSAEWGTARKALDERQRELQAELADLPAPAVDLDPAALSDPRVWAAMTLDERRELLGMFVARVVVAPAGRRGPYFDTGRITVQWRER